MAIQNKNGLAQLLEWIPQDKIKAIENNESTSPYFKNRLVTGPRVLTSALQISLNPLNCFEILYFFFGFVIIYIYIQMGKKIEGEKCVSNAPQKCAVCMEKNAYASIDCVHRFCMHCITKWTQRNNSCPLCRAEINQIKYGKRIKKVPKKMKLSRPTPPPRQNPQAQITWKPVFIIGIPYMNYYYLMNNFMQQA